MTELIVIREISKDIASPWLWDALCKISPDSEIGWNFIYKGDVLDPRTINILGLLEKAGLSPVTDFYSQVDETKQYRVSRRRQYDLDEIRGFELLELIPRVVLKSAYADVDCGMSVEHHEMFRKNRAKFIKGSCSGCFVSEPTRGIIERAHIKGAEFRDFFVRTNETRKQRDGSMKQEILSWSSIPGGRWWWLASKVILPPFSPKLDLRNVEGQPIAPGDKGVCIPVESNYLDAELRYTRSALRSMKQPFDIAMTRETIAGANHDVYRSLLVTRKFRELAERENWKIDFRPVRIDEDL